MQYDYLIVGSGMMGAIIAHEIKKRGFSVLVIDQRNHIGGNCYTENIENINVHKYGPHIFHTDDEEVWNYINKFATFNNYVNSPLAIFKNKIYSLPFNMNTYYQIFNKYKIKDIEKIILNETKNYKGIIPQNLEEQSLKLVGKKIYSMLIKGYTEKQWGRKCSDLPPSIIQRLPIRMTFNNNYFNDQYQGVAIGGYTTIFEKLLKNIKVLLNTNYKNISNNISFKKLIYTGMIDEYYNYRFGKLEYRSLIFKNYLFKKNNFQGNAVINYTDKNIPYTRIIEHKHFEKKTNPYTYISYEYSVEYNKLSQIPYYPIGLEKNIEKYNKYKILSQKDNILFLGRLGEYKYYDMDDTIKKALNIIKKLFS